MIFCKISEESIYESIKIVNAVEYSNPEMIEALINFLVVNGNLIKRYGDLKEKLTESEALIGEKEN